MKTVISSESGSGKGRSPTGCRYQRCNVYVTTRAGRKHEKGEDKGERASVQVGKTLSRATNAFIATLDFGLGRFSAQIKAFVPETTVNMFSASPA